MSGDTQLRSMTARRNRRHKPPSRQREHRRHGCWDHVIVAPLWVAYQANLGTLLRTCDAVGACMAVPATTHYRHALNKGDTLAFRPHLHWVRGAKHRWIERQRAEGKRLVAVELSDRATPLALLEPARQPTVLLLGHESIGVPDEVLDIADEIVQIPMVGVGVSLNVAVAGSLVAYRLAGMS